MKNALRVAVLLLSVVALYVSAAVPVAMADGNPPAWCNPGSKSCK
ncbi:MAG TPA: hypothetical protein VKT29_15055 [Terriglobales bacterium]|nr:hypothetical protein [Terriglobales bacterium]